MGSNDPASTTDRTPQRGRTADPAGVGRRSAGGGGALVARSYAWVLATAVVLGVLGGVAWRFLSPAARFQVTSPGNAQMGEAELMRVFSSDGTFLVVGIVGGAVLAGVLTWAGRRLPWFWTVVVLVAAVAAAAVAWGVGLVVARRDTQAELSSAKPGDLIAQPLGLHAHVVLAGWAFGAALVLAVVAVVRWYRLPAEDDAPPPTVAPTAASTVATTAPDGDGTPSADPAGHGTDRASEASNRVPGPDDPVSGSADPGPHPR